jgi:hypothetical protein
MRRVLSHSRKWALVPLLLLSIAGISTAHAVPVAIKNGETKTGTITGTNTDSYSFSAGAGTAFIVSVGENGTHSDGFLPEIDLVRPDGLPGQGQSRAYSSMIEQDNVAEGTWKVNVTRLDQGNNGGGYAVKVIQIPGATGTQLTANSSGSISRGGADVWTFTGTAGRTATITLTKTGDNGFTPQADVFAPSGAYAGGISCPGDCLQHFVLADGTYTVVITKADGSDVTGTYNLSVTGN